MSKPFTALAVVVDVSRIVFNVSVAYVLYHLASRCLP